MENLVRKANMRFGQIDTVIANAAIMDKKGFFDFEENDIGELTEPIAVLKSQ